jgi:biotin carboxyl carrier protein
VRRYRVTIDGRTYDVEVDDPRARPVTARISGEVFLIDVETSPDRDGSAPQPASANHSQPVPPRTRGSSREVVEGGPAGSPSATGQRTLMAPMPGTIVSVAANAGQSVRRGDELVTIEAMKMFNVIRSPWAGILADVHVKEGKRVMQGEPLVTLVLT